MATIAAVSRRRPRPIAGRLRLSLPLWAAILCSRLLIMGAAAAGALLSSRVHGWAQFDPGRLSSSLGSLGNILAAASVRWDAIRYLNIAQHGYLTASQTVSFPLYSVLIRAVAAVIPSAVLAGVLISVASFVTGLTMLRSLVREELGERTADATILLLTFAPLSFYFTAIYTESLFMALAVGTFYFGRQGRFTLACLLAAGAALTHIEGVLLVVPLAIMWWRSERQLSRQPGGAIAHYWPLGLAPVALAGFFTYMYARGFGLLAPITNQNQAGFHRTLVGTPVMLWRALEAGVVGMRGLLHGMPLVLPGLGAPFSVDFQNVVYLVVLLISLLALASAWDRLPKEYAIFAGLTMLLCTSSAARQTPLLAYDRYMLPIFPLWIGAAAWLSERRILPVALILSAGALSFYTFEFARWVFIA
jgi:hypothetical protein